MRDCDGGRGGGERYSRGIVLYSFYSDEVLACSDEDANRSLVSIDR